MVGRFIPIKGFDIALKAFGKFIKNLSTQTTPYNSKDIIMSVIGKGPQKKLLLKIVEDLNIQDNVTFINWVSKKS
jgi:glycosyltransferase involved in cell wall biosynthesis